MADHYVLFGTDVTPQSAGVFMGYLAGLVPQNPDSEG